MIGPTRLGDAILTSGILAWLNEAHPGQPITLACGAPAALAFAGAPGVTRLHVMRKLPYGRHWLGLWAATIGTRWDRVVDLRRSMMPWLLRARQRHTIPRALPGEHRVAQASRALGVAPQPPRVWPSEADRRSADQALGGDGRPLLALGPGANWICKTWPMERFVALAHALLGKTGPLAGGRLLLVGSADERDAAQPLRTAFGADRTIDAFGAPIGATAALLARASLFVGNDSAMMHLAAAAGARTVGLFGPTHDEQYGPWGGNGVAVRTPETVAELLATRRPGEADASLMLGLTVDHVRGAILVRWPTSAWPHSGAAA